MGLPGPLRPVSERGRSWVTGWGPLGHGSGPARGCLGRGWIEGSRHPIGGCVFLIARHKLETENPALVALAHAGAAVAQS